MTENIAPAAPTGAPRPGRRRVLSAAGLAGIALRAAATLPAVPTLARAATAAERRSRLDNAVTIGSARLDALAAEQHAVFNQGNVLRPFDVAAHGAQSDVRLHRITTWTRVPETGEDVKISGLLAVPAGARGRIPVVSWQHGTILAFDQVPSNLTRIAEPGYALRENVDSAETLLNVHRFAAQGFAVIAADYLGKGPYREGRPEAYAVKDATTQTCMDMLDAGVAGLRDLGFEPDGLFLNGWSQGGLNTQWLAQALQRARRPVLASAAASPFNDLSEALRFWTGTDQHPAPTRAAYPAMPAWISLAIIIVLGSYEAYYRLDGLMRAAVRPAHHDFAATFWRDYGLDFDPAKPFPNGAQLLAEDMFQAFTAEPVSAFLRQLAANRATYWEYEAPMRLCYGLADEAIHPVLARRPLAGGGRHVEGVAVDRASHRVTFLANLYGTEEELGGRPDVLRWFRARLPG